MKKKSVSLAAALILMLVAIPAGTTGVAFAHSGHTIYSSWTTTPPVIDGNITTFTGEWADATQFTISPNATGYVKNDGSKLYMAAVVPDVTINLWGFPGDGFGVFFDTDPQGGHDGVLTPGSEDGMAQAPGLFSGGPPRHFGADYLDLFWLGGAPLMPPFPSIGIEPLFGGVTNGLGECTYDGVNWYYEFEKPLNSGDYPFDMATSPGQTVGLAVISWEFTGGSNNLWPPAGQDLTDATTWGDLVLDADTDGDGVGDSVDNCPTVANAGQQDQDQDGVGDACDNCPTVYNPGQANQDGDGFGDACDPDIDNDGVPNQTDNCPTVANPGQQDQDQDGVGDACDNCPAVANPGQEDQDQDGVGDDCDNCPTVANPGQEDQDADDIGDACDPDIDDDGVPNETDNCPTVYNPGQEDQDGDGIGDACEPPPSGGGGGGGGFCFIATAAYGSYLDSHVQTLRDFRDQYLETNPVGSALVSTYYELSPPVAEFIDDHPALKPIVRAGLMPAVALSTVAVNTTLAEKIAMVSGLALVSLALGMWLRRRSARKMTY